MMTGNFATAVLAIDLGGTNVRVALVDNCGTILFRQAFSCPIASGFDTLLTAIHNSYLSLRDQADLAGCSIVAAGIGIPGLINRNGSIMSSVNLRNLEGFNLKNELARRTGLATISLNDANAAAMGEHRYGAGRFCASLLHLTLGTGVGSGLILEGRLWIGSDGFAAEFGHATVDPEGVLCQCGNHGCLEQYASATAIERMAREGLDRGEKSLLERVCVGELDAAAVAVAAKEGDLLANRCFATAGRYLGIAIASIVNLLNLDAIVIGGGVSASYDLLAPHILAEIKERAFSLPGERVTILKSELGDDAGLLGAATAAWKLVTTP